MSVRRLWTPTYSHGGETVGRWPAVIGNTTNSGRPIQIAGAHPSPSNWPLLVIVCRVGTATVLIEANGSELDDNGNPISSDWIDVSNGGFALNAAGDNKRAKRLPPTMPMYRTRISVSSGGEVASYVPLIVLPSGIISAASYPLLQA